MSALNDIYKLRSQLESSMASSLTAAGFAVVTRANAPADFQQIRPRIELKAKIGAATGHRNICPDGLARYDCYRVTFAVQVVSAPSNDGISDLHEQLIGKLRATMEMLAQYTAADETNFPNVFLALPLRDSGTVDTLKSEDGVEYSVLTWESIAKIRESAWPQPTT